VVQYAGGASTDHSLFTPSILKLLIQGRLFLEIPEYLLIEGRFLDDVVVIPKLLIVRSVLEL